MTRYTLGLVAAVLLAGPIPAQDKAEDVVKKAITAHGGIEVLKKFPAGTSRIAGKVSEGGTDYPFTGSLAFSIPGKVRVEMVIEALGQKTSLVQIVNGKSVKQTENGKLSKLDDVVKAELQESAVIQEMSLLYPLLNTAKYKLTAEKDAMVDGRQCVVVVAHAQGLKDTKLSFDRKTGYLVAMQRKGLSPTQKAVDEMTTFSDYKTIQGTVVPMKSKVTHDGKPFLEIAVADYKPLEQADDKLFSTE